MAKRKRYINRYDPRQRGTGSGATVGPAGGTGSGSGGGGGGGGNRPDDAITTAGLTQPPPFAYDPAIEAERLAAQRGLADLLQDLRRQKKYAKKDFKQTKRDLRQDKRRGMHDIRLDRTRGLEEIGENRSDIGRRLERGGEDFASELAGLTRRFNTLGHQQAQNANAAGTLSGSTVAAGNAQRAANFQVARAPLDTEYARLQEDAATAMGRLGTDESRLLQDTGTSAKRLRQDVRHDRKLSRRDLHRDLMEMRREKQRGIREQAITDLDLIRSEIFDARTRHPGAFAQTGQKRNKKRRNR